MALVPSLTLYCGRTSRSASRVGRMSKKETYVGHTNGCSSWMVRNCGREKGSGALTHLMGSTDGGDLLDACDESNRESGEGREHDLQKYREQLTALESRV